MLFYWTTQSQLSKLEAEIATQERSIQALVSSGQECPDAMRDLERKKQAIAYLEAETGCP